ncbi:LysR family transcriptional regulator [Tropicibacter oceani]|uniref:LysR family transcriptional regulator n=1 Tax=Tropicibacter oceani TaxID=3058420 RepID=A0ABY8QCI3_9RHOB|nr:LysR family transcriptional regulator [Tropicibacter oceani]WGW02332.1 LysR family transcriptional regulator [Tropicibacter oceani]
MQPEWIETFLDLVETRSFNQTADRLGLTQSTVSARMAALEKRVGRRLFRRSRAGTALTTAGLTFEPHAREMRHLWTEALRTTLAAGNTALAMRVGLQIDLAGPRIGAWVTSFRELFPEAAFYIELDYSTQMCTDLLAGNLDLAVMFTPRPLPDLHFESIGEVRYRLVSSLGPQFADIDPARYIRGAYSAAFSRQHQRLLPQYDQAPLSCGQSSAVVGLLTALGGAGFVLEDEARMLVENHGFAHVKDAPGIAQTIYTAVHLRHRHSHASRRLISVIRNTLVP